MSSTFPTLAEQLAGQALGHEGDGPALVAFFAARETGDGHALLPPGSRVVDIAGLEQLVEVVGASDGDVLLVAAGFRLTAALIEGLRRVLATDSACATVSFDAALPRLSPGIPPPSVTRPRPGAVLVRRDHLALAIDEAASTDNDEKPAGQGQVVGARVAAEVLAWLERPGFVHRAFGSADGAPASAASWAGPSPSRSRVVIDGRSLAYGLAGTQVFLIGLVGGLQRAGVDVSVALREELHPTIVPELTALDERVSIVDPSRVGRPEIYHKPHQFWSLHDVAESVSVGRRLVLTQLDMILERSPAYPREPAKWQERRETTEIALASADQVGFLSAHSALDAASDGTLELDRATVVHCGVDHLAGRRIPDAARPLGKRPYLFLVGNAHWHKNRLFALRLLRWLVDRERWDGGLVLAGAHPPDGTSVADERAFLDRNPSVAERVSDLGHVPEQERLALFVGAELVLFPSYFEGFGFVPFEAAALGTACVYSYRSSMRELLPEIGALPSFDVDVAGRFVLEALEDGDRRRAIVDEINLAARDLTWDRTAAGYLEVYTRALERAPRGVDRRLLALVPGYERVLRTRSEVVLVDVYRRRRAFRLATDAILGAGHGALRGARRLAGSDGGKAVPSVEPAADKRA